MEIGSQIKIECPKIVWTRAFSIVKIKFQIFHFKYYLYKSMPNSKICLNEVQTLEQSHQIC